MTWRVELRGGPYAGERHSVNTDFTSSMIVVHGEGDVEDRYMEAGEHVTDDEGNSWSVYQWEAPRVETKGSTGA